MSPVEGFQAFYRGGCKLTPLFNRSNVRSFEKKLAVRMAAERTSMSLTPNLCPGIFWPTKTKFLSLSYLVKLKLTSL
jgi:hypothetical protein